MKILVLCGGESVERNVSVASGDAVGSWLAEAGYEVVKYDPQHPGRTYGPQDLMAPPEIGLVAPDIMANDGPDMETIRGLADVIETEQPAMVFPILHGGYGEDGTLQAVLDWMNVPYTGSGVLACALAMHKVHARRVMQSVGVPTTEGFVVTGAEFKDPGAVAGQIKSSFGFPVIVKPVSGGSTIGLTKVRASEELAAALQTVRSLGDDALVEAQFDGREIAVTVVAGEAFPLIEIRPRQGFYDYANKYTSGRTDYIHPPEVSTRAAASISKAAEQVFKALGCSGFARLDFLINDHEEFVCLEANTLPGMTKGYGLVPKAARAKGWDGPQLVRRIVECALERYGLPITKNP